MTRERSGEAREAAAKSARKRQVKETASERASERRKKKRSAGSEGEGSNQRCIQIRDEKNGGVRGEGRSEVAREWSLECLRGASLHSHERLMLQMLMLLLLQCELLLMHHTRLDMLLLQLQLLLLHQMLMVQQGCVTLLLLQIEQVLLMLLLSGGGRGIERKGLLRLSLLHHSVILLLQLERARLLLLHRLHRCNSYGLEWCRLIQMRESQRVRVRRQRGG